MATEKRMIDMDVAIERARASDNIVGSSIWETCEVVEFLEDCPIVDAVEVVHGRWVMPTIINGRNFKIPHCSVCNEVPCGVSENTKYCAICGARMDLENTKNG